MVMRLAVRLFALLHSVDFDICVFFSGWFLCRGQNGTVSSMRVIAGGSSTL